MAALDERGNLIPGDKLLAIFARYMSQTNNDLAVVCDITASEGLLSVLQECGARGVVAPCGSGIIKKYMKEHAALLGGELSCHFFFADRGFGFDDGIYAALRLLEIIQVTGQSLLQLNALFPEKISSPQYRVACAEDKKKQVVSAAITAFAKRTDADVMTLDGARIRLPHGWGLVRASNTLPVVVFRFESDTDHDLSSLKKEFADLLSADIGADLTTIFGL
jgi:phosphomannomutase / phosphoglucomutase